jgi:hypothetical protein
MRKIAIIAITALCIAGCAVKTKGEAGKDGSAGKPAVMENNFTILKQEEYGGLEKTANYIITAQKDLVLMYKDLSLTEVPIVDFNEKTVVALFMGQKNTGGYSISIESVTIKDNTAIIQVNETVPEGMAATVMTSPYCIAVIPKSEYVRFEAPVKK